MAMASVCPSLGFCVQGVIGLQSNQFVCVVQGIENLLYPHSMCMKPRHTSYLRMGELLLSVETILGY